MKLKLYKVSFGLGLAFILMAVSLLFVHIYWGDRFFPATRYFSSPQSHFYAPNVTEFSVAVVGDTGAQNYVLERVIDNVRKSDENYAFILYLGDFVTKKTRTGLSWVLHEIRPRLKGMPFYATPGNHDVEMYHTVDKQHYRSMLGSTYYWFGYGNVLFIALDSSGKQIEDEQFEWLDDTLTKIRPLFKHCLIYSHKPPVDLRPGVAKRHTLKPESAEKLAAIVGRHKNKIDMMVFGHVHYFANGDFAGVPIYTIPAAGQKDRSSVGRPGYLQVTFNRRGIKSAEPRYIDFRGPKREYVEYFFAQHVFGYRLRNAVSVLLILAAMCLGTGVLLRHKYK